MARTLRTLFSVLLLAALVAPVSANVCAGLSECAPAPGDHSCCETPRIADCECSLTDARQHDEAEPARRDRTTTPQPTTAAVPAFAVQANVPPREFVPIDQAPPLDSGGRLSLLSILIV